MYVAPKHYLEALNHLGFAVEGTSNMKQSYAADHHEFWLSRPTFVTGATGLLGGCLVRHLHSLHADVVCLVRSISPQSELARTGLAEQVRIVHGDLRDKALVEQTLHKYKIDTVFHVGAQTIVSVANRDPISTFETNIGGTWSLLEACRHTPTVRQVIVASSDKAYGDQSTLPYQESMPLAGCRPYEVSKACADMIARTYAVTYSLPVAITRCGNFYGGGDLNWSRIVPGTIRAIVEGQRPVIRSDGKFVRDYFYVEDGAAAYLLLAEQLAQRPELRGEAFNFSNEIQITVLELVQRILKIMNSDLQPDIRNEASQEIHYQYLSAEKARRLLNWSPRYELDEALALTVDWYQDWLKKMLAVRTA